MEFDWEAWMARVDKAQSSEELRALIQEIPLPPDDSSTEPGTTSDRDSTSNTQTGKTPGGSETGSM